VLQSLWSPSSRVRDGALLSLSRNSGKTPDPALIAEVIKLLDIPELGMQAMAARTLGRLKSAEAVPALIEKLNSEDQTLAQSSIFALGLIGKPEAAPPLRALLADSRRRELWPHAAEALAKTGTPKDAPLLLQVFEEETFRVTRMQCLIALVSPFLSDHGLAHPSFEAEEKLPGSEIERRLKSITASPRWPAAAWKPDFNRIMELTDRENFLNAAESLLVSELKLFRIIPEESGESDGELIARRFIPGGRMRDAILNGNARFAVNFVCQLKLWAQLKYNASEGEPRFLFLAILMILQAQLETA